MPFFCITVIIKESVLSFCKAGTSKLHTLIPNGPSFSSTIIFNFTCFPDCKLYSFDSVFCVSAKLHLIVWSWGVIFAFTLIGVCSKLVIVKSTFLASPCWSSRDGGET